MTRTESEIVATTVNDPRGDPGRAVILLGPQSIRITLKQVLADQGVDGRFATVTAGWQEREDEVEELQEQLGGRGVNLRLHARGDEVFRQDSELSELHQERQQILQGMQRLYDVRLRHTMAALVELERRRGPAAVIVRERAEAMEALQALDRQHLDRIVEIHGDWDSKLALGTRESVRRHREEVAGILGGVDALAIAGGHVAVLLNRLRLFDVLGALGGGKPVIGWSGGAIVLTERIIFYHDNPPQGPGNAEVFETGFGLARDVVALPHAWRRLRLDDRERVSRFARRFAPASCVVLGDGAAITLRGDEWSAADGVRRLGADGSVREMRS